MRILNLTGISLSGFYTPDRDFSLYIQHLLDVEPTADEAEMDDRAHDIALSASMYELSGDDFGEVYADQLLLGAEVPVRFRPRLEAWAFSCGLSIIYGVAVDPLLIQE